MAASLSGHFRAFPIAAGRFVFASSQRMAPAALLRPSCPIKNHAADLSSLPRLPVPVLEQTIKKFLRLAKPLVSAQEYQETTKVAEQFLVNGEGEKLQELLQKRAKSLTNWLTPWWLNAAYLEARTPLPVVTSPGVLFPHFPSYSGQKQQVDFAAKVIVSALRYFDDMKNGRIVPDKMGSVELDMSQYAFLFGTTRLPKEARDELRYGADEKTPARHIVVARNGYFFRIPALDNNGAPLSYHTIKKLIEETVLGQSNSPNPHPIGIVSSDNRDAWARVYKRLKQDAGNAEAVETLETALFLVCIDKPVEQHPDRTEADEQALQALHGGGLKSNSGNRWFDKTLQFVIGSNGYSGLCYEHTPAEGPPVANLMDYICDQINANKFDSDNNQKCPEEAKKLEFTLTDADRHAVEHASQQMDIVVRDIEIKAYSFRHFGKDFPKSQKLSPDSFLQLCYQLAYYRLHKEHPPTYETATLRKFQQGRTDTIRLPNPESAAFVEAAVGGKASDQEVATLFRKAVEAHKNYSVEAMNGRAIDRHLLGLKMTAIEGGMNLPKLLMDTAYQRMMHFKLSTSQVPTRHRIQMCFGPFTPDCYGICYNPQEHEIHFSVSAFHSFPGTSAVKFYQMLEKTLLDMQGILVRSSTKAKL